jgi:hypothetical protein
MFTTFVFLRWGRFTVDKDENFWYYRDDETPLGRAA